MINEFSSVWAILTRLTELVLWLIAQLAASINSINDHETRILDLEAGTGGNGATVTNEQDGDTISATSGVIFLDASSGPVHITLATPTIAPDSPTPLIHIVCVSATNLNSITAPIRDAVGNPLTAIRFLNSGQSVTLTWHAPSGVWFVVGASFSGDVA